MVKKSGGNRGNYQQNRNFHMVTVLTLHSPLAFEMDFEFTKNENILTKIFFLYNGRFTFLYARLNETSLLRSLQIKHLLSRIVM